MMRRLGVALALLVGMAASAWAQGNPERAEALNEQAKAFYQAKQFQPAIDAWESAFALDPQSGWLFNVARAYEEMEKPTEALDAYRRYIAADPTGRRAPEANARIAALEADIAQREADAKAAAARQAQIDAHLAEGRRLRSEGDTAGAADALNKAFELSSDPNIVFEIAELYRATGDRLRARAEYERYQTLAPTGRHAADAAAHRQSLAAPSGATPPPRTGADTRSDARGDSSLQTYGLITGGIGVAALGTGIFFGVKAGGLESDIEDAEQWSATLDGKLDDGEAAERNAIIGISVGAIAIAAGATMYVVGSRRGKRKGERALRVSPTGNGVIVRGRF